VQQAQGSMRQGCPFSQALTLAHYSAVARDVQGGGPLGALRGVMQVRGARRGAGRCPGAARGWLRCRRRWLCVPGAPGWQTCSWWGPGAQYPAACSMQSGCLWSAARVQHGGAHGQQA
jgi:hypothetical protein